MSAPDPSSSREFQSPSHQRSARLSSHLKANLGLALRVNLLPGLLLQALAVLIALCFFYVPQARPGFDGLAQLKSEHGPWYAALATALFGGVIPYLSLLARGHVRAHRARQGLFAIAFWALMGLLVDALYTQQAVWFGANNQPLTIVKKVLFDQGVFSVFLSCPLVTVAYLWRDSGFSWPKTRARLNQEFLFVHIPTTVAINWLIWTPAVCVIYALPSPLQLPLFNLTLCFFVLLLSVVSRN